MDPKEAQQKEIMDQSTRIETMSTQHVKPIPVEQTSDLDATEVFLCENNFSIDHIEALLADKARQRCLVRKVDLKVLTLLAVTYVLQYVDKQAMPYAAVFDLFTSTSVTQTQYSWFASVFYLAYLIAEYPWMYLAQGTCMAKVVSGCVISWGAVLMLTALGKDFAGLAACRFFLGWFEAPITTCFMMIVSMWYVRTEQPFRAGIFYCCNGVGAMIGGILSYGIGQIDSFTVWKAVFLVCGGATVIWGIVLLCLLPDSILTAKFFTLEEKAILVGRARLSRRGVLNKSVKWYQIREALGDPQVWLLALFTLLNEVINGGVANFGKLIIKGIVTDPLRTTALGIPQGGFQVAWILSGTFLASKVRNFRTIVMVLYLVPTVVGTCLMWKLGRGEHNIGVLFGYYIVGSYVASLVLALQMPATNMGGYTKRITASAVVFTAYCAGNIAGPHAFLQSEAPNYPTGCIVILACSVTQVVMAVTLRVLLVRRNKLREKAAAEAGDQVQVESDAAVDLTDFENLHFRYVL